MLHKESMYPKVLTEAEAVTEAAESVAGKTLSA